MIRQAENEKSRFPMTTALLLLEREATYRANGPTKQGLFVYHFESIARNRLGYLDGLEAMAADPFYDDLWARGYFDDLRKQVGEIDVCDLVYLRSEFHVTEEQRRNPTYEPGHPPLFGEKEGKIAKASAQSRPAVPVRRAPAPTRLP